jgi:hypothetical protein
VSLEIILSLNASRSSHGNWSCVCTSIVLFEAAAGNFILIQVSNEDAKNHFMGTIIFRADSVIE